MSMPVKDEGEFELILGNKQIIAVFVIVLLLMGLFFSIGFLAGRRSAVASDAGGKTPSNIPITVDATRQQPAAEAPAPAQEKAESPAAPSTTPETAQQAQEPEPSKETQEAKPKPAVPSRLFVEQPPPGAYLQAAATQRADAEAMLSYIIGKTGLSGYVTPSPKSPELCRVIIGPLSGNDKMAEARAKLNALGVTNAFPVKY
jgi:cell division septation protein DedD